MSDHSVDSVLSHRFDSLSEGCDTAALLPHLHSCRLMGRQLDHAAVVRVGIATSQARRAVRLAVRSVFLLP